jgi:N-acetylglucosaminyldiphosphoundecaprenol N-acetyl-beta-D-mannosaminyltransferase
MSDTPPNPSPSRVPERAGSDGALRILGSRVDPLTFAQALEKISILVRRYDPAQIITANTLMLLAAEKDRELREVLDHAALVIPESWGVRWASRRYGRPLDEYVPGIDLMTSLCAIAAQLKFRVYLLGAAPGIAESAAKRLSEMFPGLPVAGTHHGYFTRGEERRVIEGIRETRPVFLFVGMTVPGQEKWIARHLSTLRVPIVMGVGGSFDVLSGQLRRAPMWVRRLGLEWVFRTAQQPWRLKRIKDLPVFMKHVRLDAKRAFHA